MSAPDRGRLQEKIAVVTGGAGGIGRAICARFAQEGATVYSADLRAGDAPDSPALRHVELDVTSESSVQGLLARVADAHGRLDILVNAAGIQIEKNIEGTSLAEWNRIFAINVTGMFLLSKHALGLLRAAGKSSIINLGSYDGYIADPNLAAYCATKGAVHALTRAMACDHGPEGIRVNAICPGYIKTPMLQSFFGSGQDAQRIETEACRIHPVRRYGLPEDVASLAAWLACDEAGYASGQLWTLDGGLTAQVQQMRL